MECCGGLGGVNKLYLFATSDTKFDKDGFLVMKRKYGKFTRPVHHYTFDPNDVDAEEPEPIVEGVIRKTHN